MTNQQSLVFQINTQQTVL